MRLILTVFMILAIITSTVNCTFAKKIKGTSDNVQQEEVIVNKKEKKVKEKKQKKQKKQKKVKVNEEKTKKKKTTIKSEVPDTPIAREIQLLKDAPTMKKRSALATYLNPNLDVREMRASHILVKKRKDAVQIRKDIINGDITFEEAAQRYSLCPSGMNGGDLGFFTRKKMEQQFSDVAFDLKIGEISKPVGTKFGWHIIKATDKR
ncbi:peptidyl-prolyl cis-trans isomerase [bacterium]|nr:peptidyl-prolyl cis-trans isomerase [bacterium]